MATEAVMKWILDECRWSGNRCKDHLEGAGASTGSQSRKRTQANIVCY